MKFNKITKSSIITFILLVNSMPVYATNVITSKNTNKVKQDNIVVISSNNGESISRMDSLNSAFRISFTDNNYVTTKFGKVTNSKSNSVPVYSKASNKSNILGSILVGSTVVIGKQEGNFSQIFFNEEIGYIENTYLVNSKPQVDPPKQDITQENNNIIGKYVKITSKSGLNLRKDMATSSDILAVIPAGTYVTLVEDNGSWLKVSYNGNIGYISSQFGTITNNKEETQTPNISQDATPENVINFAKLHLGKPYIYGSTNLNVGIDCSGFTYAVFKNFGININRVSKDQYLNGVPVEKSDLRAGDLVFFSTGQTPEISHVGIYLSDGNYIHSTDSKNKGVIISSLNTDYNLKTYFGARRVLP